MPCGHLEYLSKMRQTIGFSKPHQGPVYLAGILLLIYTLFPGLSHGQDTLRVLYHDFNWQHRDFSGPSGTDPVQQKCNGGNGTNMVQVDLPADKIPLATGNPLPIPNTAAERAECLDLNIASWFNPKAGDLGYHKSFPGFLLDQGLVNDGLFEYDSQTFYPIDTVTGAQIYANGHNNLFCLEVHKKFTYIGGEVFNFRGDDDVWLYINNKLAIDLGGLHTPVTSNVDLDARAAFLGITKGNEYDFDFYYCERQYSGSSIRITTNIPIASPPKVSTPVATPGSTSFNSQVSVSLATPTPGATIYYTTDGSTPDSIGGTSKVYTAGIPIIGPATIKAIAYKAGWTKSDMMTATYTKNVVASTLDILDQNGSPLLGTTATAYGFLTELNTAYTVKVTTTQAGIASLTDTATTKVGLDKEILTQSTREALGDGFVFTGTSPFSITNTVIGNNVTNAKVYDSLVVKWVNPLDPKDIAERRVLVRPAPVQARAYFSTKANGSDTVDQYVGTESVIYLVVIDEVLRSDLTPKATLVTTPKLGSGRTKDSLVVDMVAIAPGKYVATINVDINPISNLTDTKLQLAVEDLIKGMYTDPMDLDVAPPANAGFGIAPEIDGSLQFTDKNGTVLPAGIYYNPAEGKLYLTYSDDWAGGLITAKSVALTIQNNNGLAGDDAETFNVTLNISKHTGSTGVWEGSITLVDGPSITASNSKAETYVIGKVLAVVTSHNKAGGNLTPATDNLLVAYPNQDPVITVEGPKGTGVQITREDVGIKVTIKDQSISSAKDTLFAVLSCTETGDKVNILVIEKDGAPGTYETVIISKSEGALVVDGILQCKSTDNIKVVYADPVYGDPKTVLVLIDAPVTPKLYFSTSLTDSTAISLVRENDATKFFAVVVAHDPDINKADSYEVTFTTPQGESEKFTAVETGKATGIFKVEVPYGFVTSAPTVNQKVEGRITPQIQDNRVTATGSVTVNGQTVKTDIVLVASYAPVQKAYIKDTDGDGQADKVYIVFEKTLPHLPATLDAQWNDTTKAGVAVPAGKLSFLPGSDSTIVVADYTTKPFGQNLTSPIAGQTPRAILPNDALFANQRPILEDSIGPVIVGAIKRPPNVNALIPNDPSFNHDTLIITVSEPLKAGTDFKDLLKFSTSCDDYAHAITIVALNNPASDANGKYVVIVDNSTGASPQTGNCVFLNADPGKFTDIPGNPPSKVGVPLSGDDRNRIIQLFRGFPPVAGLDPNNSTFQIAVQDSRDPKKEGYATPGGTPDPVTGNAWQVLWIPPAGYTEGQSFNPYTAKLSDLPSGSREISTPVLLPRSVSSVQVVSTSAYIAHISIFDVYGNFVNTSTQVFGGRGELQNLARVVPKGLVSYLYWDMKDKNGQLAGQGVYVWKVRFEFKGGKQEIQYTRTGIMRKR